MNVNFLQSHLMHKGLLAKEIEIVSIETEELNAETKANMEKITNVSMKLKREIWGGRDPLWYMSRKINMMGDSLPNISQERKNQIFRIILFLLTLFTSGCVLSYAGNKALKPSDLKI